MRLLMAANTPRLKEFPRKRLWVCPRTTQGNVSIIDLLVCDGRDSVCLPHLVVCETPFRVWLIKLFQRGSPRKLSD